jgi:hypothetical protein
MIAGWDKFVILTKKQGQVEQPEHHFDKKVECFVGQVCHFDKNRGRLSSQSIILTKSRVFCGTSLSF